MAMVGQTRQVQFPSSPPATRSGELNVLEITRGFHSQWNQVEQMPLTFPLCQPFTATPVDPALVPGQLFQGRCVLLAELFEGSGCFIQHATEVSNLLLGFRGAPLGYLGVPLSVSGPALGVDESTLTLGGFSKSGQQKTLALD
jgi:hypothetical protein